MSSNGMPMCRSPLRGKITCILGPMFSEPSCCGCMIAK
ncbi:hypothetical protein TELCIR_22723 [Teladorsagia circumcincta]|uniref:Uncharacterized protein n=1 Tax=Teladorsagia circumcincta TaxID=45464 RepID=A0A2G9TD41_TELCI|nr:hypothetical protein TELCIR_22723 [Teladorsagia circumcincta]